MFKLGNVQNITQNVHITKQVPHEKSNLRNWKHN